MPHHRNRTLSSDSFSQVNQLNLLLAMRRAPIVAFLFLTLLTSCALFDKPQTAAENGEIQLVDGLGRLFAFNEPARRAVTIAPGATEVVFAAGGFDRLIGVSNVDDFPQSVTSLPQFSVLPMDFEAIVALEPDLVLASSQVNDPHNADMFDELNIPVYYLDTSSWSSVHASIRNVGILLGTEPQAIAAQTALDTRVEDLKKRTTTLADRPRGIFLVSNVTSYSFGADSYVQDVLDWAGIESLTKDHESPAPVLSDEWVLIEDPDVIIGTFPSDFTPTDLPQHHASWERLQAVEKGTVFSIEPNLISRPGPRNVDAAYQIAKHVHPQLFITLTDSI